MKDPTGRRPRPAAGPRVRTPSARSRRQVSKPSIVGGPTSRTITSRRPTQLATAPPHRCRPGRPRDRTRAAHGRAGPRASPRPRRSEAAPDERSGAVPLRCVIHDRRLRLGRCDTPASAVDGEFASPTAGCGWRTALNGMLSLSLMAACPRAAPRPRPGQRPRRPKPMAAALRGAPRPQPRYVVTATRSCAAAGTTVGTALRRRISLRT